MRSRNCVFFACVVVAALAVGGGAAYAANRAPLLLGVGNSASAPTTLTNPNGTALSVASKPGTAPLRVNNATKVAHLNADLLDGIDSSGLALTAGRTGIVVGAADDADGYINTARCPAGTVATGGGGYASGTRDYLYYSGPDFNGDGSVVPNSWFAVADGTTYAWVVCYNPRGPVPGAVRALPDLAKRGTPTGSTSDRKSTDPDSSPQKPFLVSS
jgi:hypothetical protein